MSQLSAKIRQLNGKMDSVLASFASLSVATSSGASKTPQINVFLQKPVGSFTERAPPPWGVRDVKERQVHKSQLNW